MSVAETIFERFGGREAVADLLGVNIVQTYRWTYPKDRKGTGGKIPSRHWSPLLKAAKARGIKLRLDELAEME